MAPTDPILPIASENHIGPYTVVAELSPGKSVLASGPGGRLIVLKNLDPDCLSSLGNSPKLHPGIRDRLMRVSQLAHGRVANLHGVEHAGGRVYLVWEYAVGETLEHWALSKEISPSKLMLAAQELILTLEALHARGIVHGAIHGRNVIVDADGNLKLTHISPLLYGDPLHDLNCVAAVFSDLAKRRGEPDSPLARLAVAAEEPDANFRSVGAHAASLIDFRRDEISDAAGRQADLIRRRHSRIAAAGLLLAALLFSYVIMQYSRQLAPKLPRPPEASPEAVR